MDVAVLTARSDADFHYSPLKLKEYMAAGRAIVAPRIGDVARTLSDGMNALLYEPGDVDGLAHALSRLLEDSALRTRLGLAARRDVEQDGTWDAQLKKTLATL